MSPLVTRARGASYDTVDSSEERGTVTRAQASSERSGYQIITSNSNLKLNSGIYVPTHVCMIQNNNPNIVKH